MIVRSPTLRNDRWIVNKKRLLSSRLAWIFDTNFKMVRKISFVQVVPMHSSIKSSKLSNTTKVRSFLHQEFLRLNLRSISERTKFNGSHLTVHVSGIVENNKSRRTIKVEKPHFDPDTWSCVVRCNRPIISIVSNYSKLIPLHNLTENLSTREKNVASKNPATTTVSRQLYQERFRGVVADNFHESWGTRGQVRGNRSSRDFRGTTNTVSLRQWSRKLFLRWLEQLGID